MLSYLSVTNIISTLAGLGFLSQITLLLNIPIILLKIIGFSTFRIRNDRDRVKGLLKLLNETTYSSSTIFEYGKERPAGMFVGRNCFGYYSESSKDSDGGTEITLFTSNAYFKKIMNNSVIPCESLCLNSDYKSEISGKNVTSKPVTIWHRYGSFTSLYYQQFKIDLSNIQPLGCQSMVVDDIIDRYKKMKRLSVFIHGLTGTGKSTIGLLVAKELNGSYCHEFNPTDPGDNFKTFFRDAETLSEDKPGPIVIVMEEIDIIIKNITSGNIVRHKNITTPVHNKTTFNSFLDDLVFYKNIIIIMTSNLSKDTIDEIDSSYLRLGRVNAYYNMTTPLILV